MPTAAPSEVTARLFPFRAGLWPAWIALASSLALTLVAWRYTQQDIEREMRREFDNEVSELRGEIKARIAGYTQALRSAAALFAASDEVTRRDWSDYVARLSLERDYPAIQALAFARAVSASDLGALVREMRKSGAADFAVRPPGKRERYVVNVFAEPYRGLNIKALGYDMWQDPDRREAMQRARDTGEPVITRKVTLKIDEQGNPTPAFIMYLPVVSKSRSGVYGYVLSPVRMPLLMGDLLNRGLHAVSLDIHDGTDPGPQSLLYRSTGEDRPVTAKLVHSETLMVGGRPWTLNFASHPELEARAEVGRSFQVLAGGLLTSLLLFSIVWSLATTRDRALRLAREMTGSLRESEARFRTLVEQAPDAIVVYDMDESRFVDANAQAERLFGCAREELLQAGPERFYPSGEFSGKTAAENVREMLERALTGEQVFFERTLRNALGRLVRCELRLIRLPSADRRLIRGSFVDITERKNAEEVLARQQAAQRESEERLRLLLNSTGEAIYGIDLDGRCTFCNPAGLRMLGWGSEHDLLGRDMHATTHYRKPDGSPYPADACPLCSVLETGAEVSVDDDVFLRADGSSFPVRYGAHPIRRDGEIIGAVVTFTDATRRKAAEDEIRNLAFYDPLTRLPNRRLMHDRLERALTGSARHTRHGALMLFDLDDFKTLNDTLGHAVGDQFLIEVATRIESCIREGDTVARLGGDEFVVILEDLDAEAVAAMQAESVAVKIQAALTQPYLFDLSLVGGDSDTRSYHCTASIGIALFRDQSLSVEELMKRADTAMYQAKAAGRNTLRFFDPDMQAVVTARATLTADLRAAIRESQFLLHYQSQFDDEGRMTGAEALVRWQHPRRGLVFPAEFIPLAEDSGLILPLGHWVLETACRQLLAWAQQPDMAHLTVAVNVSGRQFYQSDFVEQVLAVLHETGADPRKLKLEVTESLLLHDMKDIIAKMAVLKEEGVTFALDDFGIGYSSLSYLKRLPLAQLKIDQSFVRDVLTDGNDAAIVRTIIALGRSLGLDVIAEGVETEGQREFLARQGCHAYQGNLFGRPGPAEMLQGTRPLAV
ncbi:MAG: PAS/PAC/Chase sensor-containing diguanylate cyclase/phosphodiesterase [Rhodocyclaceae bacterium]|nr:MAG: PAS/PAC/Chase sensor-containing diguanylate cyclase/phosphodiesterase [Rhodocyclaceae bacterium]TND03733.1 MAG: PAS/PAC/Chase sensor-containing diguanylate cyclase/phosphodiesterase [Rhodocyclaceae bacterium]